MSAGGLKDKVLGRAQAEAQAILDHARKESEEHTASSLAHAVKKAERTVAQAREAAQSARSRAVSAFEREAQQQRLAEKNRLIEEAFDQAAGKFASLHDAQLSEIFKKELAGEDLAGATVAVPPGSTALFRAIVPSGVKVEEVSDLDQGYRLIYASYRVDRSLAARLEEARQALRSRLAEILFGKQD